MAKDLSPLSLDAYRLVFEANPHPILLFETEGWRILAANEAAAALYGWSKAELETLTLLDLRPESERERFLSIATNVPPEVTHVGASLHQARDGRLIQVDITTAGLTLDDGRAARISVVTDVTEERQLREARERLVSVVAGSYDAIITTDIRGRIQSWNPSAERIFGYTEDEACERSIALIHPPGAGRSFREMAAEVVAGRGVRVFDAVGRHKDGREIVLSMTLSPTYNAAGEVVGIAGIERDVTDRHRAEQELRASEARFARIFHSDLILSAIVDVRAQRFTHVNESWLRFFGMKSEDVAGVSVHDFRQNWLDGAQYDSLTQVWMTRVAIKGVEVGFQTRTGPRYALLSVHQSPNADEDLVVMLDITERRRLETELSEARRLEALGRLAGGVAHDFNNMLSVMSGYAELLEEQFPEGDRARADLQEIRRAADRATELTRQLLAFGRRQMLQPRTIDLNHVIAHTETFLQRVLGEHATLRLSLSPEPLRIEADPSQIERVLLNLASNARDSLNGSGVVQITTKTRLLTRMWAREHGLPAGPAAELAVRDTGRGMDAETLQRIFEPFFTTKDVGEGTGLGLATVYGIVKQSGGHIEAASTPGQGSLFRVVLPLVDAPDAEHEPPAPERAEGGTETILLVEDEKAVATLTESLLKRIGYRVLVAHSAAEAVALAGNHTGGIDLLLTDVVMPGASGCDLAGKLRGSRPSIKVLYMSGYPADDVVRHGVEEGEMAFLQKPFSLASLAAKVREVLSSSRG
ncbi:MAG TPA: PAS domain S-box protein [Vicinamibacterales bacterium]|nr:PAS domain S-box protein [Vicinamibacterales bacterium]